MDKILLLAKQLIAIPSVDSDKESIETILGMLKQNLPKVAYKEFEKNGYRSLLFSNGGFNKPFKLLLNGHVDVVPAKPNQFKPKIQDGKLYGRGSLDMKSAVAVMVLLFKEVGHRLHYPLALQIATDEEIGGYNSTKYQLEQGVKADFAITSEMTNLCICNETKGVMQVEVIVPGVSAHSAYQWEGKNAINQMISFLYHMNEIFPELTQEAWHTSINPAVITTPNTALNKVPDQCSVLFDIRYIPEDAEKLIHCLKNNLPAGATIRYIEKEPAQYTKPDHPYIKRFITSYEQVLAHKPTMIKKHGTSDMRTFNAFGIPGLQFGPGGYGIHTDGEYVELQALEQFKNVLKEFLLSLNS